MLATIFTPLFGDAHMTLRYPAALSVTERVLKVLRVLNFLNGAALFLLLVASLVAPTPVFKGLVGTLPDASGIRDMRMVIAFGFAAVPITHVLLARLRAIVATVRDGDPFVLENAHRLNQLAFTVLALELLHLAIGAIVKGDTFAALGIHIDWSFSLTPWIAVLLLFVLSLVFEHGARMRADLEGTV